MITLIPYVRPYWRIMLIVLMTILVVTATGLLGPWGIRAIVGLIANNQAGQDANLVSISAGLAADYVVRSLSAAEVPLLPGIAS